MKKRLLSTLCILLCLALLGGCTLQENTTPPSGTTAAGTAVKTTASTAAAAASTAASSAAATQAAENRPPLLKNPNVNLPGVLPICKETETLTVGMAQSTNIPSYAYADNFQTKWMQDRSNVQVDLQLFPSTDANQKLELMIASNSPLPDVLVRMGITTDAVRFKYGQAGAIIPLNDYYEQLGAFFDIAVARTENEPDHLTKEELFNYTKSSDGNLYGSILYYVSIADSYCHRAWMNGEWLEKLGLPEPTTLDELIDILRAFRDGDPNGNGQKDEIPMVGAAGGWNSNPILRLMNAFVYVDSSGNYYLLNGGTLDVAYDKPEWREGLRFVKSLTDEGLISTLSFTQDYSQYVAMVSAETPIVGVGVSGSISGFGNNKADYIPVGALEGPNGVSLATYSPQPPLACTAITRDCKSPDLAFRWLDMGYDWEYFPLITELGEPSVDWDFVDSGSNLYESLGYKPLYKTINNIWGTVQQKNWENLPLPFIVPSSIINGQVWDGDMSNNEYKNSLAVAKLIDHTPAKQDIVYKITYTDKELDQYSELRTALITYVNESMVRFVMGDMDIEKDWDKYLSELKKLKYKEVLAVDQAAYDRTVGK